ncbi:MAG: GAF domain-containing protein [Anaerolineae bacterium]|jgi:signal transduction histidine kinase
MEASRPPLTRRWKQIFTRPAFWTIVAALVLLAFLHYFTPQTRLLPTSLSTFLSRHAVERIVFILPIAGATFAFGLGGGLIILILSVLIMLPRALWLSPHPVDAMLETVAAAGVGYLAAWMIGRQQREKALRQRAVSQLRAINAVSTIVTGSLELEQILNDALDKVLEVTHLEVGLIFFLDSQTDELVMTAYRGISPESAANVDRLQLGEGFCGRVAESGELMMVEDSSHDPRLTRMAVRREHLSAQIIVPLKSKDRVQGVLAVASRRPRRFPPQDLSLIQAIGNQIGVAIENAQLHRDVARQLSIQRQLNEVAQKITSELELDRVLPTVLQLAEELIRADAGVIGLHDRERHCIRYPYIHNLPVEITEVTVSEENGLAGQVIATGLPAILEDYSVYPHAIPEFVGAKLASVVAVPIVSGNQRFGMLAVGSLEEPRRFRAADARILTVVGRQAGIAIENAQLYENMRFYARQITRAQEAERKRIAREAHDETAQLLVALTRRLDALVGGDLPPESIKERVEELRRIATDTLRSVRRFTSDLRPPVLDDLGLLPAVKGLIADLKDEGIEIELRVNGEVRRISPDEELTLFRIVQEALNNVRRHAEATRGAVEISFQPRRVKVLVEDNGKGFVAPDQPVDLAASGKLGLIGMHERARILGGTLSLQSRPGEGTRVVAEVPVQPAVEGQ